MSIIPGKIQAMSHQIPIVAVYCLYWLRHILTIFFPGVIVRPKGKKQVKYCRRTRDGDGYGNHCHHQPERHKQPVMVMATMSVQFL